MTHQIGDRWFKRDGHASLERNVTDVSIDYFEMTDATTRLVLDFPLPNERRAYYSPEYMREQGWQRYDRDDDGNFILPKE